MAQTPGTASTQPTLAVTFSSSQSAGTVLIGVQDGGSALAVAPGKAFQSLVVSAPWLSTGDDVALYRGGRLSGSSPWACSTAGRSAAGRSLESITLSSIVTAVTS